MDPEDSSARKCFCASCENDSSILHPQINILLLLCCSARSSLTLRHPFIHDHIKVEQQLHYCVSVCVCKCMEWNRTHLQLKVAATNGISLRSFRKYCINISVFNLRAPIQPPNQYCAILDKGYHRLHQAHCCQGKKERSNERYTERKCQ